MLFVSVKCRDEIDRAHLIPANRITDVFLNADGSDEIFTEDGGRYIPRTGRFIESIEEIDNPIRQH